MKLMMLAICSLFIVSCATKQKEEKVQTPEEQVKGLEKMCADNADAIKKRQAANSLYNRLGKKKKITVFASQLYDAHKANKDIGHMFKKVPKKPFVKRVVSFLVAGTGGPGMYEGRGMKEVHAKLNITAADFLAAGGDVNSVMKGLNYGDNEIQEIVCALVSFVPDVVVAKN